MTLSDIKKATDKDLNKRLVELRKGIRSNAFAHVSGGVTQTHVFRTDRREVARILTVLNERSQATAVAETSTKKSSAAASGEAVSAKATSAKKDAEAEVEVSDK